jgi:hypothetical protein
MKRLLTVLSAVLFLRASPAPAQDFTKVIEIVDEMETSLKASDTAERDQRKAEVDSLRAELQSLRTQTARPAADLRTVQMELRSLTKLQKDVLVAVQKPPSAEAAAVGSGAFSLGADLVSRYVWRGIECGDSPAIQPTLNYTNGAFAVGTWGSMSFTPSAGSSVVENDLYLTLNHSYAFGSVAWTATDYYYPSSGIKYFRYRSDGSGAHTVDLALSYTGPSSFPLNLTSSVNVCNDPEHARYLELGYGFSAGGTPVKCFAGGAMGQSTWYAVNKGGLHVINAGVTVDKTISVSDQFRLPLSVSFILNPTQEVSHLVVKISF